MLPLASLRHRPSPAALSPARSASRVCLRAAAASAAAPAALATSPGAARPTGAVAKLRCKPSLAQNPVSRLALCQPDERADPTHSSWSLIHVGPVREHPPHSVHVAAVSRIPEVVVLPLRSPRAYSDPPHQIPHIRVLSAHSQRLSGGPVSAGTASIETRQTSLIRTRVSNYSYISSNPTMSEALLPCTHILD